MNLTGKNILIGITGGIAAYKICTLVSSLKKQGANVDVAMTKNATEFVSKLTFETLSGNPVTVDTFVRDRAFEVGHVSLAKKADICIIAPATADFVGKLCAGIADDFLSTTVMACRCPVLLCPAMNTAMLTSAAYVENEKTLRARGFYFMETGVGRLACGDEGAGRLAEPEDIEKRALDILFPKKDLDGVKVLISAGGTIEYIDPVRYIGNNSSGKMGLALATAAADRGALVTVIKARTTVSFDDKRFKVVEVETTEDMLEAALSEAKNADIIVKSAAPCDFKPVKAQPNKLKANGPLTIELTKTQDIAAAIGKNKGKKKLVVFAAETENLKENAVAKLKAKNADMIVANDVTKEGAGFGSDTNIVTIIKPGKQIDLPKMTKRQLADIIFDELLN